jgi:hypothetical protein
MWTLGKYHGAPGTAETRGGNGPGNEAAITTGLRTAAAATAAAATFLLWRALVLDVADRSSHCLCKAACRVFSCTLSSSAHMVLSCLIVAIMGFTLAMTLLSFSRASARATLRAKFPPPDLPDLPRRLFIALEVLI